ncbi:Protease 4 [Buchnera aphidicola (Cinara piceae)]|uniref:Protease 4 n=1 Tax=Buchnera aphidicola (Cinara piceae) TaxID=1660043 RepID=A0A803FTT1_9GAMM|nr:signal peptide peptidase SppA [Buchnera aphidicola]VFP88256.1 Protease 4 [Buchnera aphidicola (Cinara piceae)]
MQKILKFVLQTFKYINKLLNIIKEIFLHTVLLVIIGITIWVALHFKKHTNAPIPSIKPKLLIVSLTSKIEEISVSEALTNKYNASLSKKKEDEEKITSIFEITDKIEQAKNDPEIVGLMLRADDRFSSNQVVLEYIGKKINEFKESKKPVVTIGRCYSQGAYYLASFSDKIFLSQEGNIQINGISTSKIYLKKFLDKFHINMNVFKIGKYKSAVEPFLRNSPSKENKKIEQDIIQYKWKKFVQDIAHNRNIPIREICPNPDEITKYLQKHNNNYAKYALHYNLVDYLVDKNSVNKYLIDMFYKKSNDTDYETIDIHDYKIKKKITDSSPNKIAIILANGVIGSNINAVNAMNVRSVADQIYIAKHDKNVKAVVLRINSPGGNVEISEIMRKKLLELHKHKKPLIISMGDVAASGGYWIATAGDYIFAHKTTLTGSIGIFSVVPTLEKILSTLGITNQIIDTKYNSSYNLFNSLSEQYKKKMNLEISNGYNKFITIVAKARHKSIDEISDIAQGRVWMGANAKKVGLVDEIGDIDSAVKKAAQLANVKDYNVLWLDTDYSLINFLKEKINLLTTNVLKNVLYTFVSKELINKISIFYNNIFYITNIFEFNQLMSLYYDDYKIK